MVIILFTVHHETLLLLLPPCQPAQHLIPLPNHQLILLRPYQITLLLSPHQREHISHSSTSAFCSISIRSKCPHTYIGCRLDRQVNCRYKRSKHLFATYRVCVSNNCSTSHRRVRPVSIVQLNQPTMTSRWTPAAARGGYHIDWAYTYAMRTIYMYTHRMLAYSIKCSDVGPHRTGNAVIRLRFMLRPYVIAK